MRPFTRQHFFGILLAATLIVANTPVFADSYTDAVADYRAGRYKQAYNALRELHRTEPGNTRITYYLAMTEVQLGKFEQARGHYGEVLTLAPESDEARLAEQGLGYLPANNPLDTPPRPASRQQTSAASTDTGFPRLERPEAAENTQPYPGYFEPSSIPAQNGNGTVSAKTARAQQQQAAASNYSHPNAGGMTPQDLMALQMMMGGMNGGGGNTMGGMNPYMMMYGMPQQGVDPNNPGAAQNPYQQMDPNIMSTMMMNQMLNNFSFMDNNNNK